MNVDQPARRLAGAADHPLLRLLVYYALLFTSTALLVHLLPGTLAFINAPLPASGFVPGPGTAAGATPADLPAAPWRVVVGTVVALASACALMLPVTWLYVHTRRKKGYQQSIVQTLIALPLVVAGVILLVQDSTALAFSLGGIVGAVTFRNTLRDTKDTIYIFLAIVIGVAAGVHALLIAATISVGFNAVAAIMWWTDFGRVGARLEGPPAERRLRRARALANRTGGFVSLLDQELLRSMTPEQLDAVAERARVRQHAAATRAGMPDGGRERRDWTLRVEFPDAAHGRRVTEPILATMTKRWQFVRASPAAAGGDVLEYHVRTKKKTDRADFIGRFRAAAGSGLRSLELERSDAD